MADVVAADHQITPVVGAASNQDVDVRVVGVPMVDRHPVELRVEILGRVLHELAGEGAQVGHLAGVFGRDDEAEMVPVVFAPAGERLDVGLLRSRVEHMRPGAVAGDALAFEIADMPCQGRGAEAGAGMADDACGDDRPSAGRA